ncbi:MAG: AAA family ATPase [Candidatus Dadabacteria bacterium]|nr:AAA family ATPase [Candidatus Dadabacteria bacterium]
MDYYVIVRIDQIRLKDFKGLEQFEQRLHPNFTVIVGDNGAGKTSILDALSVAMGSYLLGIPKAKPRHIQRHEARELVRFFESGPDYKDYYPVEIEVTGTVLDHDTNQAISLSWCRELISIKSRTTTRKASKIKKIAESAYNKIQDGKDLNLPLLSYYGASRSWNEPKDTKADAKPSRFDAYRFSHDPKVSSADLIRWVRDQHLISLEGQNGDISTFAAWKEAVSGCFESPVNVRYSVKRGRLEICFRGHGGDGKKAVAFNNLSHGQRTIISMVGDIAYKAMKLNPHLGADALVKTSGIVLIDEIDLHLHPKWQRQIVGALSEAFPKIQFVATTHSPFIIQSLKKGMVVNLDTKEVESEAYNLAIEDIAESIQLVEMPQRSEKHRQLMEASSQYYQLLEKAKGESNKEALDDKRRKLDEIMEDFADNPAAAAMLKFNRLASGIDK